MTDRPPLTLPAITPSSWELVLPGYPVINNTFRSVSYPELLGSFPSDARWKLTFENVSNDEALSLLLPWKASGCGLWPLTQLPPELAGGVDDENFRKRLLDVAWTMESEPTKDPVKKGRHNVRISLIHELSFESLVKSECQGLVRIDVEAFAESAGIIHFHDSIDPMYEDEYGEVQQTPADSIFDPVYEYTNYNGTEGQPTVSFGSLFEGQSINAECENAFEFESISNCITGEINSPLALAIEPETENWGIMQTEVSSWWPYETAKIPVLLGGASLYGPITILFDQDVAAVGMNVSLTNVWDESETDSVILKAYSNSGELLGEMQSFEIDDQSFTFTGAATCDGAAKIRGIQIISKSSYAIDDVRFARAGEVTIPPE